MSILGLVGITFLSLVLMLPDHEGLPEVDAGVWILRVFGLLSLIALSWWRTE